MSEGDEAPPDPLAALDQVKAGLHTRAALIRSYFESLKAAGFNDDQALTLTVAYQNQFEA